MGEIKDNNDPNDDKMKLVQEVVVPKWCNYNPYLFIKKQRELLECNEVSANINKWINLIFGSLQKGQEANKIHNLFAIQSYENYEKTYDELPVEEKDVSRRMLEFGITPNQVFKNDTSQRNVNVEKYIKNKLFYNTLVEYKKLKNDGKEIKTRLKLEEIKDEIKMAFNPNRIFYFPKDNNVDNINKSYSEIYVMNNENLFIYYRKPDKIINKKEGYEQMIVNDEGLGNDLYEEIAIKKLESKNKEKINLINLKHGFNNTSQPIIWINNGTILVKGGYWNGNIVLQSLLKEKEKIPATKGSINNTKYIYTTNEYSPITKIVFDKYETFAICGNANGTIYIFRININNKLNWTIYKVINDHNSPIVSIALHENLNIAITCSENGLCMLYSLPYFKLYNSFILGKDDKDNINDEILCPDIVLISDTPLPCFIFYVNDKRTLYFYSINGKLLSKYALNYELNEKSIKIYKDYQFVEYLVLYNYEKKYFEIRSMVEFELIGCSPVLDKFEFIDFIFGLDMEHILVFGRNDGKYKLYVIYDSDNKIIWK
jgi:WD40 repeat protein